MAKQVVVPRLGWTMEEGTFVQWLKNEGEPVRRGEGLFVLEGDKAAQDVESLDSGLLRIAPDAPQPGATVAVGTVLAYLVEPGEQAPWRSAQQAPMVATDFAQTGLSERGETLPATADRVTRTGVDAPAVGNGGRTAAERTSPCDEPVISPRARRIAAELGIDWRGIEGSGRTGRIRERDVRAQAARKAATITAARANAGSVVGTSRVLPVSPVRKTIAERMLAGAHSTAPVTLTTHADATNLASLRQQFQGAARGGLGFLPSYTDLMIKLVAVALREHSLLNSCWSEGGIAVFEDVHIGIAVDTDSGLRVPVLRDVQSLTLRQVSERSRELIELARAARLTSDQVQGGTFTLTNLGMHNIDAFTPIINAPQCAILGMGRVRDEAAVVGGRIVPRSTMALSLTFDHRIVDGGPAARFLNRVRGLAEQPCPWLVS